MSGRGSDFEPTIRLGPGAGGTAEGASISPSGTGRFGRYMEAEEIARGGMGVILRATDRQLHREVALKLLGDEAAADPTTTEKFWHEAQVTGQLEHPNIVPLHELSLTADGRPFFSMKLVRGRSLEEVLERGGPARRASAELARLLGVFLKVCDAVAFAHSRGVIHRDLKPANVMIGEFGEVLVMDWGLARVLGTEERRPDTVRIDRTDVAATMAGTVLGTPSYMSPEQATGDLESIGASSDVYSLGAMLYEILCGEPPYDAEDGWRIVEKVRRGELVPPSLRSPTVRIPRELEAAVLKAMARRKEDRYRTVGELKADIEAYLAGRILSAAEYGPVERAAKWARRHRSACLLAAAAVAVVAGALGWSSWRAGRERDAERARSEAAFGGEVDRLESELERRLERVAAVAGPGAPALVESNGEPSAEVVDAWYRTHAEAVEALEALAELRAQAPSTALANRIDLSLLERRHRQICLAAALRAIDLGDDAFARSWLGRASDAGLAAEDLEADQAALEAGRGERIARELEEARGILSGARDPSGRGLDFFDYSLAALTRRSGPDLVRLLLDPEHLDSPFEWERRLAIEALGRIGDTRTRGPEGLDPVQALCRRLEGLDLHQDLETAVAIARALGYLRDPRANEVLDLRRNEGEHHEAFRRRTEAAFARIPMPARDAEPAAASDLARLGRMRLEKGFLVAAERDFSLALELDPRSRTARLSRGHLRVEAKRYEEARGDYEALLEIDPADEEARLGRAIAFLRLGQADLALGDLERILSVHPDHLEALNARGSIRWDRKDYLGARADFEHVLRERPDDEKALANRANARAELGDLEGALGDYSRAIAVHPDFAPGYHLRGALRIRMGDLHGALADCDRSIELDPSQAGAYGNRSLIRIQMGDLEGALADLDRTIEIDPDLAVAYANRGYVRIQLHRGEEARPDFERALEVDPGSAKARNGLGLLDLMAGRLDEAVENLRESARLDPAYGKPWYLLAQALARRAASAADVEEALAALERAVELDPDYARRLATEESFDALRDEPRFQRLGR